MNFSISALSVSEVLALIIIAFWKSLEPCLVHMSSTNFIGDCVSDIILSVNDIELLGAS